MRRDWFARGWGWLSVILIAAAVAAPCHADDIGVRDTCRFTSGTWIISGDQDSMFSVELWGWNDDTLIIGATLPFKASFDTTGFDPVEWNVHQVLVHFPEYDQWVWVSKADSFIVVDTFIYDPNMQNEMQTYQRSLLDCGRDRSDVCHGYNGFLLGILNIFPHPPIFESGVATKIGDLYLKIIDPGRLPDSFHIEVDSMLFGPSGTFKYSPMFANKGHAPDFTKSVITVIQVPYTYTCGDVDDSGEVDIDDVVYLIAYIFSGGPPPDPHESGRVDCSGLVDIDDVVYLIGYIFSGGNAPCDIDGDGEPDC